MKDVPSSDLAHEAENDLRQWEQLALLVVWIKRWQAERARAEVAEAEVARLQRRVEQLSPACKALVAHLRARVTP